jgi:flagellar biosynthesis/type III secretory pathway protein FliH
MAAKYQFPELKELPLSASSPTPANEAEFTPIYNTPTRGAAPSTGAGPDGWSPLYRRAQAEAGWRPAAGGGPASGGAAPSTGGVASSQGSASPAAASPLGPDGSSTAASTGEPRAEIPPVDPARSAPPPAPPPPEPPRVDPRELERIKAQARQEGYQEGFAKGESEGRAVWQKRSDRLEQLLLSIGEAREALFHRVREDLVRIMCIVPRKILRQELKIDRRAIVSLVGSVLEELPRQDRVVVKVAPEDLSLLEEAIPDLRRRLGGYTQVEVEPSAQVNGGGAIVVVDGGRIEATIERQLETFEQRAREWLLGGSGTDLEPAPLPSSYAGLSRTGDV